MNVPGPNANGLRHHTLSGAEAHPARPESSIRRHTPLSVRAASHPLEVRIANLDRVLDAALARAEPFTRGELAAATKLSVPTICSLADELTRLGLLQQVGRRLSAGRRASLMEFNAHYGFVVSIHIGPTRTCLGLCDFQKQLLAHRIVTTPTTLKPEGMIEQLTQHVLAMIAESCLPQDRLLAVAIGVPGVVNDDTGVLVGVDGLPEWRDVPVRDLVENALGSPVLVSNAVNLALVGEHGRGAARGHETCAFISVGPDIGAAVMINGELHRGQHFMAGKIGLMCVRPPHVTADSDERGCPGSLAEHRGLSAVLPQAVGDEPPAWCSSALETPSSREPGTPATLDVAHAIGIAVANTAALIDPSVIVLGGSFFAQAPGLIASVKAVVRTLTPAQVVIVPSALGSQAPLWGGLLVGLRAARERLRSDLRAHYAAAV